MCSTRAIDKSKVSLELIIELCASHLKAAKMFGHLAAREAFMGHELPRGFNRRGKWLSKHF